MGVSDKSSVGAHIHAYARRWDHYTLNPTYVIKYLVGDLEAERVVEDYHAVLLRGVGQVAAMG